MYSVILNDGNSFESYFKEIYPEELQLNKENADSSSTNFLDLHINIVDRTFNTHLFDKRDHFGFNITRLPAGIVIFPIECFTLALQQKHYAYAGLLPPVTMLQLLFKH